MFKYLIYCLCILFVNRSFGLMPTIDVYQQTQDLKTMSLYTSKITASLFKLGEITDIATQLRTLKSLQDIEKNGAAICRLCSNSERSELQDYINQVNDDLCSQFSTAISSMIGIQGNIKTLQDIIRNFNTNPKEAGLALQAASLQTQAALQTTMSHVRVLLAQQAQKQLAEEKLAKQNSQEIYLGIKHNGL